jgi:biotin carboxyl carrier protein
MKKLRVTVEGKVYEVIVEILDEPGAAAAAPATLAAPSGLAPVTPAPISRPSAPAASASGDIPSPLAGKVVSIDVQVGQTVEEGAQLATVEAMKMNTYIYAPRSGTVAAILVTPGDGVEEGAALLRLG